MEEKNKIKENQIWMAVMMMTPIGLLMNIGNELTDDDGTRVLLAGTFGLVGCGLGLAAHYLTQHKSRLVKSLTLAGLLVVCLGAIFLVTPG